MITTLGRAAIVRYVAGYSKQLAECLVLGAFNAAESLSDSRLAFESVRVPIKAIGADLTNNKVIFKATLPADIQGKFYEAGVFSLQTNPGAGSGSSKPIFSMATGERWSGGTYNTTNTRVGARSLRLSPAASATVAATLEEVQFDLSAYSAADQFLLAHNLDANVGTVRVRLGTDASNYYQLSTSNTSIGYKVTTFTKGAATTQGSPSWSNIRYVQVAGIASAGGVMNLDIDSLRVEDTDTLYTPYSLISRKVLATPVTKLAGVPTDIEYSLPIGFA